MLLAWIIPLVLILSQSCSQSGTDKFPFGDLPRLQFPVQDSIRVEYPPSEFEMDSVRWTEWDWQMWKPYASHFRTCLLGMARVKEGMLLHVAEVFEEEKIHSVVLTDRQGRFRWAEMTAYWNSEGFLSVKSQISRQEISKTTLNSFSDPERKTEHIPIPLSGSSVP